MTTKYTEISRKDWLETLAYLLFWLVVIGFGGFFLLPAHWYIWTLLVGGTLWGLVHWHAKNFAYRCSKCGYEFEISDWVDFISPQGPSFRGGGWKYLKCPHCQARTRARELKIIRE